MTGGGTDASTDALRAAASMVSRRTGLRFDPGLLQRLRRAVTGGAARSGETELGWVRRLEDDDALLAGVVTEVTIQESAWFRDPAQFEALRRGFLPRSRTPVVWSIGCALGQEAYSLAMTLREAGRADIGVVATDVSPAAVASCARGVFTTTQLDGLDPTRRQRWLQRLGDDWEVHDDLRRQVVTIRHNIARDAIPSVVAGCDLVFCRNVLIYLTDADMEDVLGRLAAFLPDRGNLFLGSGEALWRALRHFEPVELGDGFSYRPRREEPPAAGDPGPSCEDRPERQGPQPAPLEPAPGEAGVLFAAGSTALERGDTSEAVRLLRQAVYLDQDLALAQFTLGVAIATGGDPAGARRAWEAARAALGRADPARVEGDLDGHSVSALALAIDARLQGLP